MDRDDPAGKVDYDEYPDGRSVHSDFVSSPFIRDSIQRFGTQTLCFFNFLQRDGPKDSGLTPEAV